MDVREKKSDTLKAIELILQHEGLCQEFNVEPSEANRG